MLSFQFSKCLRGLISIKPLFILAVISLAPHLLVAQTDDMDVIDSSELAPQNELPKKLPAKRSKKVKNNRPGDAPEFAAIIQYKDGPIKWRSARTTKPLDFKTVIEVGDHLLLDDGARLKIVTLEHCTGVIYGPSTLFTPSPRAKYWKLKGGSLRWLCPSAHQQTLRLDGARLELGDESEILYHQNKLLVRKGPTSSVQIPLEKGKLYEIKDRSWVLAHEQPSTWELWHFNQSLSAPKESYLEDEPSKDRNQRYSMMIGHGGASFEPENGFFDNRGMDTNIGRLQINLPINQRSWQFALTLSELNHRLNNSYDATSATTDGNEPFGIFTHIDMAYLEAGIRKEHTAKLAAYYRFGLGGLSWNAHYHYPPGTTSLASFDGTMNYIVGTFAAGLDYTLQGSNNFPWSGLNLGLELRATRTIGRMHGESYFFRDPSFPEGDELFSNRFGAINTWSIFFYIGPSLYL